MVPAGTGIQTLELYETGGELTRRRPLLANRTPPEVEAIILELTLEYPA